MGNDFSNNFFYYGSGGLYNPGGTASASHLAILYGLITGENPVDDVPSDYIMKQRIYKVLITQYYLFYYLAIVLVIPETIFRTKQILF